MSTKKKLEAMGATPGKLALIGVLVVVLGLVIVKQLPKGQPGNNAAQQAKKHKTNSTQAVVTTTNKQGELAPWPEMKLSETLTSNPFAPPSWDVEKQKKNAVVASGDAPGELAALKEQGASIVVIGQAGEKGKEKKTATIGETKYQVGDILEGYQITDITTQGIYLNKLNPR